MLNISTITTSYTIVINGRRTRYNISYRGKGKWAVVEGACCLGLVDDFTYEERARFAMAPDQKYLFEWEPSPSNRDEDFLSRTRFDSDADALEAFRNWALGQDLSRGLHYVSD